jgi:hypothetical protein
VRTRPARWPYISRLCLAASGVSGETPARRLESDSPARQCLPDHQALAFFDGEASYGERDRVDAARPDADEEIRAETQTQTRT